MAYNTTDFCLHKCGKMQNICCIYNPNVFGYKCGPKAEELKFGEREKKFLVHIHNQHRQNAASGLLKHKNLNAFRAANMHVVSYSEQLAYSARCWSNQCKLTASRCRAVEGNQRLGEILCFEKREDDDKEVIPELTKEIIEKCLTRLVKKFSARFTKEIIDSFVSPIGNKADDVLDKQAIQSIWAKTRFFGCHRIKFPHSEPGHMILLHICHYLPRLVQHKPIFIRGTPGNHCIFGSTEEPVNEEYPKLCGVVRSLKDDTWQAPFLGRGNILRYFYWNINTLTLSLIFIDLFIDL